jgi:predicted nucleic-acid-binding Zn-ribbon protein
VIKPKKRHDVPNKCVWCGSDQLKQAELSMYGKLGFMGPDYRFDVYMCKKCGHAELFFQGAKWIA